jgi:hypothetical protein
MKSWLSDNRRFWLGLLLLFLCALGCASQSNPGPYQPTHPNRGLNENTIIDRR